MGCHNSWSQSFFIRLLGESPLYWIIGYFVTIFSVFIEGNPCSRWLFVVVHRFSARWHASPTRMPQPRLVSPAVTPGAHQFRNNLTSESVMLIKWIRLSDSMWTTASWPITRASSLETLGSSALRLVVRMNESVKWLLVEWMQWRVKIEYPTHNVIAYNVATELSEALKHEIDAEKDLEVRILPFIYCYFPWQMPLNLERSTRFEKNMGVEKNMFNNYFMP